MDLKLGKTMRTHVALEDTNVGEMDPGQRVCAHADHRDFAGRRFARHRIPPGQRARCGSFTSYGGARIGPACPLLPPPYKAGKYLHGQGAFRVPYRFLS